MTKLKNSKERRPQTLGVFDNFPSTIHLVETFSTNLDTRQLQQKIIRTLFEANRTDFSFEEAVNPTLPGCKLIFEFGLGDADNFNYIDMEEEKKTQAFIKNEDLTTIDFFCAIRYYKTVADKNMPLKFDYYMLRTLFGSGVFEMQISHTKGPRYLSPEDLTLFIVNKINEFCKGKVLEKTA